MVIVIFDFLFMHYLHVYKTLLHLNFEKLIMYRVNFINSIISSCGWGVFQIVTIFLLTTKVDSIYGWSKWEIIALTVGYSTFIGFYHSLFSKNFERFSEIIDQGALDTLLLKPLDSQWLVSCWHYGYPSFIRSALSCVMLFYIVITKLNIEVTLFLFLGFVGLNLIGIIILYSIWMIVCTLMVWSPKLSNLVELLYNVSSVGRFPQETTYKTFLFAFFFFFPITLVVTVPVKFLLQKPIQGDLWGFGLCAVLLFILARMFWRYALRFYTSASG